MRRISEAVTDAGSVIGNDGVCSLPVGLSRIVSPSEFTEELIQRCEPVPGCKASHIWESDIECLQEIWKTIIRINCPSTSLLQELHRGELLQPFL